MVLCNLQATNPDALLKQASPVMNMVMTIVIITSDQSSPKSFITIILVMKLSAQSFVIIILVMNLTGYVRDHYIGNQFYHKNS